MKATKKIVGAACALVAAVALSAGSTFAWFAQNNKVTATGLAVDIKSASTFLLISSSNSTLLNIRSEDNYGTVNFSMSQSSSKVYPCKPLAETDVAATGAAFAALPTGSSYVTSATTAASYSNWFVANGTSEDDGTVVEKSGSTLDSFSNYVITKTVYLAVADGALPAKDLKVKAKFTRDADQSVEAIKVLITTKVESTDGGFVTLSGPSMSGSTLEGYTAETAVTGDAGISTDKVTEVNIYIYYDGSHSSVTTNGFANLSGASIELEFSVTADES
ncbi:MAG: hypothetical protein ACI4QI_05700, partial [Candidatus Coproplasma sp.]